MRRVLPVFAAGAAAAAALVSAALFVFVLVTLVILLVNPALVALTVWVTFFGGAFAFDFTIVVPVLPLVPSEASLPRTSVCSLALDVAAVAGLPRSVAAFVVVVAVDIACLLGTRTVAAFGLTVFVVLASDEAVGTAATVGTDLKGDTGRPMFDFI